MAKFSKDLQYYKFGFYGFLKNLRLFEPFLILFFLESGLSFLQIGVLYSFREIARNIMEIPAGVLADASGRRRSMVTSFSAYIFSFLAFYFGHSYGLFFGAMLLYAVGDAFRTGTHKAMIFDYLKIKGWADQKANYYGHTRAFSQFGSAISSLVAAVLVFYSGSFRFIFIITAIPYFLDLLLLISYPKELDGAIGNQPHQKISIRFKTVLKEFYNTFQKGSMFKVVLSNSWYSGFYKVIKDFIQPMIVGLAIGIPLLTSFNGQQKTALIIGPVYFVIYLLTSISSKNTEKINKLFSSEEAALNKLMFMGISAGILASIAYIYGFIEVAILVMIPVFLIENIRKPLGVSIIANRANKNILASALSVQSQIQTITVMITAPILGYLSDKYGLEIGLFLTSLLFLGVSFFLKTKNIKSYGNRVP